MRLAVVTIAHGRHDHLTLQRAGLAAGSVRPDLHVVVAMGDPDLPTDGAVRVDLDAPGPLPLAAARNAGAARAFAGGADAVVFLDVDVVPGVDLLTRYAAAVEQRPDAVLSGPVSYLPAGVRTLADMPGHPPHPARPAPADGELVASDRPELFWSLSYAATAGTWARVGGFDEAYVGYGGEDTDFGRRCEAAGVPLVWVGGALGYHLHHPVSSPPVEHLDDVLRNGRTYAERWGEWPMTGWLEAFEGLGLVRRDGAGWEAV